MFLYSTVSTLKPVVEKREGQRYGSRDGERRNDEHWPVWILNVPMVGMVVTISPSLSLYRMVVFPAASRPTIRILISFFPHNRSNILEIDRPIIAVWDVVRD
jgi:hypothetical protein